MTPERARALLRPSAKGTTLTEAEQEEAVAARLQYAFFLPDEQPPKLQSLGVGPGEKLAKALTSVHSQVYTIVKKRGRPA